MKAEIIAVGTELLMGEATDTNSTYLGTRLPPLGIELRHVSAVRDELEEMVEALERAWERSELIIVGGGLGPTEDDRTREAIARFLSEEQTADERLVEEFRERFRRLGRSMPERNLRQAMLIPSAVALPNPMGTAPGWWIDKGGHILVSLPGVPLEMRRMWEGEVEPRLRGRPSGLFILKKSFKIGGLAEAVVDEMLGSILANENPSFGIYARIDGIHVRMTAKSSSYQEAQALLAGMEPRIREILSDYIWGEDEDTLGNVLGSILKERGLTLAAMESCTGGLLATTITDTPGSSIYFKGGIVSYTREAKEAVGVDRELLEKEGTVSPNTALAMAKAIRARLGADVGMGVTGVAGPEPLEGKPVGTVYIAVDSPLGHQVSNQGYYPQDRLEIKRRAVTNALHLLRRHLLGLE